MEMTAMNISNELNKYSTDEYGKHCTTQFGVQAALDEAEINKKVLREIFSKHPNCNDKNQIIVDEMFERDADSDLIENYVKKIAKEVESLIVTNKNAEGKTVTEVLKNEMEKPVLSINELTELDELNAMTDFTNDGYTVDSVNRNRKIQAMLRYFVSHKENTITDGMVTVFNRDYDLQTNKGAKTSRTLNKICNLYCKANDSKTYRSLFAQYADNVNSKTFKRKVVISTAFIDYMFSSFGNNWSSCHTIDAKNRRRIALNNGSSSYRGMHMSGNLSYALDKPSFIVYVVDGNEANDDIENAPKIYRCMFQYEDGYLIQGRVYPQCKDGSLDLQKKLRHVVQREICKALDVQFVNNGTSEDSWKRLGTTPNKSSSYEKTWITTGSHYADYNCYYNNETDCNISKLKEVAIITNEPMTIGHKPICLHCGQTKNVLDRGVPDCMITHPRPGVSCRVNNTEE